MQSANKKVLFANHIFYIYEDVYEPAEDSFLFVQNLEVNKGDTVLDMGTGSGILGIIAAAEEAKVVAVDLNPFAVHCAKKNATANDAQDKIFFVQGDLFAPLKVEEKFDSIFFNAPYLPTEPTEKFSWLACAWSGGTTGREIIDRFIQEAPKYLKKTGHILLMQSTLCSVDETMKRYEENGLKATVAAECALPFFETIVLIRAKIN